MLLAQHGANVIKAQPRMAAEEWSCTVRRRYEGHSVFSVYGTLGKRSIAVDLKTPEGQAILWRLRCSADLFMEGFRPGTIERHSFGYDVVSACEPPIIIALSAGLVRPVRWRRAR